MKASTLIEAMKEVGFTDEEIQTFHLKEAQKAFVAKVNELYPEEQDNTPSDTIIEVYNAVGDEPVEDWPEPKPIMVPRVLPPQCLPKPKPEKVVEEPPVPTPKKRGRPKGKMRLDMEKAEATKTVVTKLRGRAVAYSRLTAILEALRVGGSRDEVIKRADRLYMSHGGGSNIKETMLSYIKAMRVLRVLKLVNVQMANVKLKKYFTSDSPQYKEYRKLQGKAEQ